MDENTDTRVDPPPPPPTAPPSGPAAGPRASAEQMRDLGRLRRSTSDRYIAGVAGGLARHFDIDPTVVRVVLVVLAFFGGAGLLIYLAAWLFVPEDTSDRATINAGSDARKAVLIGVGVLAALIVLGVGFGDDWAGFPLGVIALAVVAVVVLATRDRRGEQLPSAAPADGSQPPLWAPPATQAYVPPPRPRRTGTVLFWPTLALVAIALGLLGMYDVDNAVLASAYPALALTVIAVMLAVGAFVARPGGLIALGLVAALGLGITSIADHTTGGSFETVDREYLIESASSLPRRIDVGSGSVVVDLRNIADPESLDGEVVTVRNGAGEIRVVLPNTLNAEVVASIRYVGEIRIGQDSVEGFDRTLERTLEGSRAVSGPTLTLYVESNVGEIVVEQDV